MSTKVGITAENYQVSEDIERNRSDAVTGLNKQQEESDGLKIHGLALPFDKRSRNGVVYQKESVEEAAETLVGCALLFNHDENNPLGHIEDVEVKEDGLYYYGDLNEERREVESLKRGDIPHVSIQATINETDETEEKGIVAVDEFLEMSAVTIPGFSRTDVEAEETVMIEKLVGDKMESVEDAAEKDEEQEGEVVVEAFEFSPIPSHVLYDSKADAMLRAKRLGLQDVHRHELVNEGEFWMAGATHEEWMQAIQDDIEAYNDDEDDEEEQTSEEPFAGYDDFDDCVQQNQDKNDPEAYCAAIKRKVEQKKKILSGEKPNMTDDNSTEEDADELSERVKEQLEQVAEDDFMGTVADMYEELSASDAASLLDEFEFTGNPEPLVALLADAADMTPADLMEVLEDEAEAGDMDDEDDEEDEGTHDDEEDDEEGEALNKNNSSEEESQSGDNSMSKSREELKEKVEELEEKIQEQEKMIEKLEDTEDSKQEAANGSGTGSDTPSLNPEFEKKLNDGGF